MSVTPYCNERYKNNPRLKILKKRLKILKKLNFLLALSETRCIILVDVVIM